MALSISGLWLIHHFDDFRWLVELMLVSSSSMVGFSFFTGRPKVSDERSYPRSFNPGFTLKGELSTKPFSGGRESGDGREVYPLLELMGDEARPIPLSDFGSEPVKDVLA